MSLWIKLKFILLKIFLINFIKDHLFVSIRYTVSRCALNVTRSFLPRVPEPSSEVPEFIFKLKTCLGFYNFKFFLCFKSSQRFSICQPSKQPSTSKTIPWRSFVRSDCLSMPKSIYFIKAFYTCEQLGWWEMNEIEGSKSVFKGNYSFLNNQRYQVIKIDLKKCSLENECSLNPIEKSHSIFLSLFWPENPIEKSQCSLAVIKISIQARSCWTTITTAWVFSWNKEQISATGCTIRKKSTKSIYTRNNLAIGNKKLFFKNDTRVPGIEPGSPEWQSGMLPLYHTRFTFHSKQPTM